MTGVGPDGVGHLKFVLNLGGEEYFWCVLVVFSLEHCWILITLKVFVNFLQNWGRGGNCHRPTTS